METAPRPERIGPLLAAAAFVAAALIVFGMTGLPLRAAESAATEPNRVVAAEQRSPRVKCNGSDEQIIQPIEALYQAVNAKNIDRYAAQWSDDAVYVDSATHKTRPIAERIANRRGEFALWESVSLTMDRVMVIERWEDRALVKVTYSMSVKPFGKPPFGQNSVNEYYDTVCARDARWLIERNVDEIP
jgi:hypothetical protein